LTDGSESAEFDGIPDETTGDGGESIGGGVSAKAGGTEEFVERVDAAVGIAAETVKDDDLIVMRSAGVAPGRLLRGW
jgi:hypothetical protein